MGVFFKSKGLTAETICPSHLRARVIPVQAVLAADQRCPVLTVHLRRTNLWAAGLTGVGCKSRYQSLVVILTNSRLLQVSGVAPWFPLVLFSSPPVEKEQGERGGTVHSRMEHFAC